MCYKQKCKVVSLNLAHPVHTTKADLMLHAVDMSKLDSVKQSVKSLTIHGVLLRRTATMKRYD